MYATIITLHDSRSAFSQQVIRLITGTDRGGVLLLHCIESQEKYVIDLNELGGVS